MIAQVYSAIPCGYDGHLVTVEGDMTRGLPAFNIVGMANKTITEARERVRAAIVNSSFSFPDKRVTINLAPAELAKDGTHLDLPIALAVLVLSKQLPAADLAHTLFVGELSLDGRLRPIRGIINVVEAARQAHFTRVVLPAANLPQASLIPDVELIGATDLQQLFLHLKEQRLIATPVTNSNVVKNTQTGVGDFTLDHIRGQTLAKRALAIAVAGHHNLLLSGPPGTGKTLLARTAANLLPPLSLSEQISVTKLHSLVSDSEQVVRQRPFRAPHHTASSTSIIGGGPAALPGEISLAHSGVLFLDELPEYRRDVLEALRQPLEDHVISISRAQGKATYPANFMLIATMNPCPCGYAGDPSHDCTCTPVQLHNYQRKLSGPLFDRFDLTLTVPRIQTSDLTTPVTTSVREHNVVKNTITEAIARQHSRYGDQVTFNSSLTSSQASALPLSAAAASLLRSAADRLHLSARAYFKVLKVAQTIADLSASDTIEDAHLAEALTFRTK